MKGRIGIQIGASTPPTELGAIAADAERLGYSEIWLAEDYFELGGIASVAAALAATEEIPVGLGVVAAAVRHPAVTAMEFATLADAFAGRFLAGLGHGSPTWIGQMGLRPSSPMGLLRETIGAVRQLLDGSEVSHEGEYLQFDHIRLTHPPQHPVPLYLGVHGPASLRLSGQSADGTLLGWFSSPGYVAWARKRIDEGRARTGRQDHHELVTLCLLSISDEDPGAARLDIRQMVGPMLASMAGSKQFDPSITGIELPEPVDQPANGVPALHLPDPMLEQFVAAGDTASCAAAANRLLDAGADRVVLVPNAAGLRSTATMVEQMRAASSLARNWRAPR